MNLGNFSNLENISKKNPSGKRESLFFELTVEEEKSIGNVVASYLLQKEKEQNSIKNNMVELLYTTSAEISYQIKEKMSKNMM